MYLRNFVFTLFTYTLAFIMETQHSDGNSDRDIVKIFQAEPNVTFDNLAVHNNGRWIYVGTETHIYQLSADLKSLIASLKLVEEDDTLINSRDGNIILELDYKNQQLISCNDYSVGCHAHNISNISQIFKKSTRGLGVINAVNDPVALIAPSSLQNLSALCYGLRSGSIYIRNIEGGIISADEERISKNHYGYDTETFIYGYNSGDVSYFLNKDISAGYQTNTENIINSIASRAGYLNEIQHKNKKNEYTGIFITCGYDFSKTMSLQCAHFYEYESDPDESETDLPKMKSKILFTVFSVGTSTTEFKVCKHYLDKTYLIQTHRMLDGEPIYHHVGDTVVTAIAVASINNHIVLFLGTNKGHLHKVSVRGFDSPDADSVNTYADIMIDEGSPINSEMLFDSKKNYLYAMTKKKLALVKIHNCDEHNTSYSCLDAKDPYCGWCFTSNRCCLKSECTIEQDSFEWISYDIDKYVNTFSSTIKKFLKTEAWHVDFYLSNSHPFNNQTIICSFRFKNTIINTTTNVSNGSQINCATPNPKDLPPIPINEHSVEARLSLQTKDFPEFQYLFVEFIDCGTYELCSQCATYPCIWYVNKQKCTSERTDDIELADNADSSDTCDGNCLTKKIYSTWSGDCPRFDFINEPTSHVYIHSDTEKKKITVKYTIPTIPPQETFTCKFLLDGNEIRKPTVEIETMFGFPGRVSNGIIECDETIFTYAAQVPNMTVNLSILWNGSIYLENFAKQHIILYKCASMGDQCATCLDKNYKCVFNSKTGECKYNDSSEIASDINTHWWNDVEKCSNFTITQKTIGSHWLIENIHWIIITIVAITFFVVAIFVIVYRKTANVSRKMQQQINKMGMEMIAMSQCVKRVVIENEIELDKNESDILRLPNVNIVYEPFSTSSENETDPKNEYELLLDEKWEIARENLVLGKFLGEGEFGRVVKGSVSDLLQQDNVTTVAVKMLKNKHTDVDMVNLVKEMELMKLIGRHDNVLSLLGCCTQNGPLLIVTEYSPHGNLLDFLRNHNHDVSTTQETTSINLSENVLITFAQQVAKGMEYLASIQCIHRDLAARNVLVFDNYMVKIADFGLARDIRHEYYYKQKTNGRFPVKWMAPEALKYCRYTIRSDVWSFGILLWEIMTFGAVPYLAYDDADKLVKDIKAGYRMNKPDDCPEMLYCLMRKCWNYLPKDRPDFTTIIQELDAILATDNILGTEQSDPHDSNITTESGHEESETDSLLPNGC